MVGLHARVLSKLEAGMSFKWVSDAQSFASSVAMSTVLPPQCWVSEDSLTYVVGTGTLTMSTLQAAIQAIMADIWGLYYRIVGNRRFVTTAAEDVVDDLSDTSRGFSFASNEPFGSRRNACFFHLVQLHNLCAVDSQRRISWNIPEVKNFLTICAKLWHRVAYLLSLTAQISIRLQQFMELTFVNGDRMRSFIWQAGEGIIMQAYSKTSHISDQDRYTPSFLHPDVSAILLEFLGGGLREAEALFVHVLSGGEAAQIHRT